MLIQKVLETYLFITIVSPATVNTVSEFLFVKAMSNFLRTQKFAAMHRSISSSP